MGKVALITGIGGQDGSYLAELLLEKGYKVIGIVRRCSVNNLDRIKHIQDRLFLVEGDITDAAFINQTISRYQPDEIYNLAAMSHVGSSFASPSSTFIMDAIGPLNILEAVRCFSKHSKVYQASTSELFGSNVTETCELKMLNDGIDLSNTIKYQDESTPFSPNSPYAVAKLAAHNLVRLYRESYNIYACAGILFNHESPRRGENFVTRKITKWLGEFNRMVINGGSGNYLKLGYIDAYRDWGHAKDYVRAMWLMMQQDKPDDFVISTDEAHTVRDFLEVAFNHTGWKWEKYVEIDKSLFRPCEVPYLCGKSTKAREALGWKPEYSFEQLVKEMVDNDLNG